MSERIRIVIERQGSLIKGVYSERRDDLEVIMVSHPVGQLPIWATEMNVQPFNEMHELTAEAVKEFDHE